jgi:hypothetical protein
MFANSAALTLILRHRAGGVEVPAHVRGTEGGWSNGVTLGRSDALLSRIIAHWFNLPNWHGPQKLTEATESGGQRWWAGRWIIETGGWRITIDVRPDHSAVWENLDKADVYVMTHVMELQRVDGSEFTAGKAEPVLAALHIGVSFALGRWVAPMLPVGQDADGSVVWEDWRPLHCDPARFTSQGWWYQRDHESLADLLSLVVPVFADADRRAVLWFQMMFAITSARDQGFVEQRVMSAAAGLEHIMWQTLVIGGQLTKQQYRKAHAHELLRSVLDEAQIPVGIDPLLSPVCAGFAVDERERQHAESAVDGATVVTQVRNRLVHPKGDQQLIYEREGLLREIWLLILHYLVLLILHSLGYQGPYRDLRRVGSWAGDLTSVPWSVTESADS